MKPPFSDGATTREARLSNSSRRAAAMWFSNLVKAEDLLHKNNVFYFSSCPPQQPKESMKVSRGFHKDVLRLMLSFLPSLLISLPLSTRNEREARCIQIVANMTG